MKVEFNNFFFRFCPGQLIWDETGDGVYGVAYKNDPRLGMIYCTNREGHVFYLSLTGDYRKISNDGFSPRCVRLSADKKKLIWLQRAANGPHNAGHVLMKMDVGGSEIKEIVPVIVDQENAFTGFYKSLISRCFSGNGMLYLDTIRGNLSSIYKISIGLGNFKNLIGPNVQLLGQMVNYWASYLLLGKI